LKARRQAFALRQMPAEKLRKDRELLGLFLFSNRTFISVVRIKPPLVLPVA